MVSTALIGYVPLLVLNQRHALYNTHQLVHQKSFLSALAGLQCVSSKCFFGKDHFSARCKGTCVSFKFVNISLCASDIIQTRVQFP
eukprot:4988646-Amphidinium_carterae.2